MGRLKQLVAGIGLVVCVAFFASNVIGNKTADTQQAENLGSVPVIQLAGDNACNPREQVCES